MNAKTIFPSKYLKAEDLQSKAVNVQIAAMEIEAIGKAKDKRPVLYFRGKEKGLVLNKTNTNKICEILGTSETEEWFGGMIQLYPTEVEFQGAATLAIRVKAPSTSNSNPPRKEQPTPSLPGYNLRAPAPADTDDSNDDSDDEVPW